MSARISFNDNTLKLEGVVDFENADACCAEGLAAVASSKSSVTVDLSGLEEMSSIGVAVLLRWARVLAARGVKLQLSQVSERGRAILQVSGLADALPEVGV